MPELVSIREAVDRLGVSESVIRRRLRAGTLIGERRQTPQGHVWLVEVPDQPPPSPEPAADQPPVSRPDPELERELAVSREAVTRLEAHCTDLRETNARLGEELAARRLEVERLIVVVREGQRALTPPIVEPDRADQAATSPTPSPEPPSDQAATSRSGWWRRAWSWLSGDQAATTPAVSRTDQPAA
jgi:hypothetical protein